MRNRSEKRLNEAQRIARLGSWEYEVLTGKIQWSDVLFRLVERDPNLGAPNYEEQLALYIPEDSMRLNECVVEAMTHGMPFELDLQRKTTSGDIRWFHAVGNPILGQDGHVARLFGTLLDITERKRNEQEMLETHQRLASINDQIEHQITLISDQAVQLEMQTFELEEANRRLEALATTDGLTGLRNHRAFQEKLLDEWNRTVRYDPPLSVILLDVDKFKSYNDTFGHPEGDKVLKAVAKLLQEASRVTDYACRYGAIPSPNAVF